MYEKSSKKPMMMNESADCESVHGGSDHPAGDGLAKTPWDRILANDDTVNFGEMLRTAMEKRNAKSR